ncbi:MAG: hypothetical protein JNM28_00760 [Armatimonadetes bacterium]|nr:hypothetical protein [Armatimonadota bacterium]
MKHLKTFVVAAAFLVFGCAFAQQDAHPKFVEGKGLAQNREIGGKFELRATHNERGETVGRFLFQAGNEETPRQVTIELKRPMSLEFAGDGSVFKGRGIMVVREGRDIRRFEGNITVRAADLAPPAGDNGSPDPNVPHDRLVVRFEADRSDVTYTFEGIVTRGDIKIGPKATAG